MAKTIKFNLICDEKPVRTIEDLQNNFSIEDVLDYYNNQLLHRWLRVRGYDKELEEVSSITSTESMDIIKELIRIFDVEIDAKKVEESIYMLKYQEEQKELCKLYEERKFKKSDIIEDYSQGYRQCVNNILDHPQDMAIIKAAIAEMVKDYEWVLSLNHRALFYQLYDVSPLAIMCLLMNEGTRKYYFPVEVEKEDGTIINDTELKENADKNRMYNEIRELTHKHDFSETMGDNLIWYAVNNAGNWDEVAAEKVMIISLDSGADIRADGRQNPVLPTSDIKDQFVILNGVNYRCTSDDRYLCYMKVDVEAAGK